MARLFDFLFGRRKGKYGGLQLIEEIGRGGMSRIWKARDPESGQVFAVKILKPETVEVMTTFKRAFEAEEGAIALRLEHPNVISTFDYGRGRGHEYYIVMEYVDGPNLETLIVVESPRLREARFEVVLQVASGLRYIHEQGLVHRDFCPKNVLYAQDGWAKVIDFGLTIPAGLKSRIAAARAGTASYMAPEQVRSQPVDQRTDIYAFGLSAFEILTFQRPFPTAIGRGRRMQDHLNVEPLALRQVDPDLPVELERVVQKCIAKQKRLRYNSMTQVIEDLQAAIDVAKA
ncbi:MAG: serine/threonine protein kinase [Planctomycetota bacterium]|jgi:serine/threonine protein kinase